MKNPTENEQLLGEPKQESFLARGVLKLGVEGFLMANHGTSYFLVQQIPAFDG